MQMDFNKSLSLGSGTGLGYVNYKLQSQTMLDPTRNTSSTPWKIYMEPETDGLEDDFPFQLGDFLVPC